MEEQRRITDEVTPLGDTARILAIMYTVGFFAMVLTVMWRGIPAENKDVVLQLIGILSIIQTAIVAFYFGGSKSAEVSQKAGAKSRAATDATLQEIAKAVPAVLTSPAIVANGKTPHQPNGDTIQPPKETP